MRLSVRRIKLACCLYIYLGLCVFFLGWIRPVFSVPLVLAAVLACRRYHKRLRGSPGAGEDVLLVRRPMLAATVLFAVALALLCGFGGFFTQAGDWLKHNKVLNDLTVNPWPVYYHNDDSSAMLTYYIAQYLCPALCGKLVGGFRGAELALLFYCAAGILGVIALLYHVTGADNWKKQAAVLACLLLFGTCIVFGKALYGMTAAGRGDVPEGWAWISDSIRLQYRSLLVNLRWAFPQAIVPWMATLLFADDVKAVWGYGPLCVPLLLYSPFALVGLVLMMLAVIGYRAVSEKSAAVVRELFSLENILSVVIALAPVVYLLGNVLGDKPISTGFALIDYRPAPALYFCFVSAFLVYSAAIFSHCKRDILFYLVNAALLLVPFFTMGVWNDFSLNVTIPAMLLLMVLVVKTLFAYMERRGQCWKRLVVLTALLACGSLASLGELDAAVKPPAPLSESATAAYRSLTLNDWARRDGTVAADNAYNYFTYDYTGCLFYNVLARK